MGLIICCLVAFIFGSLDMMGATGHINASYRRAPGRKAYQFRAGIFEGLLGVLGFGYYFVKDWPFEQHRVLFIAMIAAAAVLCVGMVANHLQFTGQAAKAGFKLENNFSRLVGRFKK